MKDELWIVEYKTPKQKTWREWVTLRGKGWAMKEVSITSKRYAGRWVFRYHKRAATVKK